MVLFDSLNSVYESKYTNFDSSASSPKLYGNMLTLEVLYKIRLAIQVKIDDKAVICQVKHIMYAGSFSFLRSVVAILGTFHFFLYNSL